MRDVVTGHRPVYYRRGSSGLPWRFRGALWIAKNPNGPLKPTRRGDDGQTDSAKWSVEGEDVARNCHDFNGAASNA